MTSSEVAVAGIVSVAAIATMVAVVTMVAGHQGSKDTVLFEFRVKCVRFCRLPAGRQDCQSAAISTRCESVSKPGC
jgi:hypothetical protein